MKEDELMSLRYKVFFQGRILKDALLIDSHSHINQIEHIGEQYEFVPN